MLNHKLEIGTFIQLFHLERKRSAQNMTILSLKRGKNYVFNGAFSYNLIELEEEALWKCHVPLRHLLILIRWKCSDRGCLHGKDTFSSMFVHKGLSFLFVKWILESEFWSNADMKENQAQVSCKYLMMNYQIEMGRTPFYWTKCNIIYRTSSELERKHLGFYRTDMEHRT